MVPAWLECMGFEDLQEATCFSRMHLAAQDRLPGVYFVLALDLIRKSQLSA